MENIVPCIKIAEKIPFEELSPQEFQQMLSAWMEEKGLVQDLRSYLKYQMVNVLKNTAIGKNIRKTSGQNHTLARQALHLIVAEYLQHHQCNFSLSLFSTEVNLTNVLPGTRLYVQDTLTKFDKENLLNIMELLGVRKECFKRIFYEYFERGDALLVCLLNIANKAEEDSEEIFENVDSEDDFLKHIYLTLQSANLPQKTQKQLLHNLKACYDLKNKTYQNQVIQLIEKFKKEFHYRDQKLHYNQKRKKILEQQIDKLKQENVKLKQFNCVLPHCDQDCNNAKQLNDSYKKEIERLKNTNDNQKDEIERLNEHCKRLLAEFNACQSKITLANAKLDQPGSDGELVSLSSDSLTEQILQQAREKLKLLEDESEELDLRFHKFVIK